MIQAEKEPRSSFFTGVTPALVAGVTFFVVAVFCLFLIGKNHDVVATPCLLLQTTRIPCPLCGGTRTAVHLLQGDLTDAVRQNPLVTILLLFAGTWLFFRLILGIRLRITGHRYWYGLALLGAFLLNWAYVISRS